MTEGQVNTGPGVAQNQPGSVEQPRDDGGRFVSTKYVHPIEQEQAVHEKLLNYVRQSGMSDEFGPDPVKAPSPQAEPAPEPQAAEPEKQDQPQEEAPGETIEFDYEAPIFEVTVKGDDGADQSVKLSLKDLQSGYMRQADYTRKTQEVSKMREEARTQIDRAAQEAQQQYVNQLQVMQAMIGQLVAPELKNVDWQKLASEDPAEYVRLSSKAQQVQGMFGQMQQQQQQFMQQQQEQQKAAMAEAVEKSVDTLKREIPGWNQEVYQTILKGGLDYGFSQEELNGVVDARVIKLLHDASKYRQLQAKPIAEKRAVVVPKVVKPGSKQTANPQAKVADDAATRLRKSGRVEDAAALFLARGSIK